MARNCALRCAPRESLFHREHTLHADDTMAGKAAKKRISTGIGGGIEDDFTGLSWPKQIDVGDDFIL